MAIGGYVMSRPSPSGSVVSVTPPTATTLKGKTGDAVSPEAIGETSTPTGVFYGYYTTRTFEDPEWEPRVCDVFVADKSDDPLFQYFSDLVRKGNTVNSLDAEGKLLMNIDLKGVTPQVKEKIVTSTSGSPIFLEVRKKRMEGKDAMPCFSFVDSLSVKEK